VFGLGVPESVPAFTQADYAERSEGHEENLLTWSRSEGLDQVADFNKRFATKLTPTQAALLVKWWRAEVRERPALATNLVPAADGDGHAARHGLRAMRQELVAPKAKGALADAVPPDVARARRPHHALVVVADDNIEGALRVLKRKLGQEGVTALVRRKDSRLYAAMIRAQTRRVKPRVARRGAWRVELGRARRDARAEGR
jgi:ribosomal protein S21